MPRSSRQSPSAMPRRPALPFFFWISRALLASRPCRSLSEPRAVPSSEPPPYQCTDRGFRSDSRTPTGRNRRATSCRAFGTFFSTRPRSTGSRLSGVHDRPLRCTNTKRRELSPIRRSVFATLRLRGTTRPCIARSSPRPPRNTQVWLASPRPRCPCHIPNDRTILESALLPPAPNPLTSTAPRPRSVQRGPIVLFLVASRLRISPLHARLLLESRAGRRPRPLPPRRQRTVDDAGGQGEARGPPAEPSSINAPITGRCPIRVRTSVRVQPHRPAILLRVAPS